MERRVFEDTKAGIFGSAGQSFPVGAREIPRRIHMPGSRIAMMFRFESLADWRGTLEFPAEECVPTKREEEGLKDTILPGGKCNKCKSLGDKWMEILLPMRATIQYHYKLLEGDEEGLTMCMIWQGRKFWFEVALIVRSPETIPAVQIHRMEVPGDLLREGPFGTYPDPGHYYGSTSDVFSGD